LRALLSFSFLLAIDIAAAIAAYDIAIIFAATLLITLMRYALTHTPLR